MMRRARQAIFWPGISNDIRVMVERCEACQTYRPKQKPEPLISGEVPLHAWDIVHQDVLEWQGQSYVVTVDRYSDFFDVTLLGDTATAEHLVRVTKRLCSAFGRPRHFRTDSDPRYLSQKFQQFLRDWRIEHTCSAPHHHAANGKAEAARRSR